MRSMTVAQAREQFGALLDTARSEPVAVSDAGAEVAVVLAMQDYRDLLRQLEEQRLAVLALEAEAEGFIGVEESVALTERLMAGNVRKRDEG